MRTVVVWVVPDVLLGLLGVLVCELDHGLALLRTRLGQRHWRHTHTHHMTGPQGRHFMVCHQGARSGRALSAMYVMNLGVGLQVLYL